MFACVYGQGADSALLLDCAYTFSPRVEATASDTVVIDVQGLDRLFGSAEDLAYAIAGRAAELGLNASVAVAWNPDAAVHAARGLPGVTVIPPGEESRVLGDLPLEILGLSPELTETLALWGLGRFRDLSALPEAGISQRLGTEGVRVHKLARGAEDRALVPLEPPVHFEDSIELEYPVAQLEPLSFLLSRLLQELCSRLEVRGLGANELRLRFQLENQGEHTRSLRLPFATRDRRSCLKLLQLDLESHPPGGPVVRVTLGAEASRLRFVQQGLFLPPTPEPEKLELTLARIAKLIGLENVGAAELLDTHRPQAFRMKRFAVSEKRGAKRPLRPAHSALRIYRPARRATVHVSDGRPIRVVARGARGQVISRTGPWRSSGDWWASHAWSRDEWDVALSDGALYRIYWDRRLETWFVEGSYD